MHFHHHIASRKIRNSVGAVIVSLAFVLAGCGSSSSNSSASTTSTAASSSAPKTLGDAPQNQPDPSAAQAAYTPTGNIVASDGFDPATNGFGFQNYGDTLADNSTPTEMTTADMQAQFGQGVCADSQCDLTPEATAYENQVNQAILGGHCFGFSVASLLFWGKSLDPNAYGASSVPALNVIGNTPLQSELALTWSEQMLDSVQNAKITGDPKAILAKLMQVLVPNPPEMYTVTIFKSDGTGGHAVTPYAIEDNGNGQYHILIYDNNYPGVVRAIAVDTNADTWTYDAAVNPQAQSELYQGDATTQSLGLMPVSPGNGVQPCPFCAKNGDGSSGSAQSLGSVAGQTVDDTTATSDASDTDNLIDVYLDGGDGNHSHLTITDSNGNTTGFVNGKLVNNIPGAQVVQNMSDETWVGGEEPDYYIPSGTQFTIKLDGSGLTSEDDESVGAIGPDYDFEVTNLTVQPGEIDTLTPTADDTNFSFLPSKDESPDISLGISDDTADYTFDVNGDSLAAGASESLTLPASGGDMTVSTTGNASLTLSMDREDDAGSHTFSHSGIKLGAGDTADLQYGNWSVGQSLPLVITQNGQQTTEQLTDQGPAPDSSSSDSGQ